MIQMQKERDGASERLGNTEPEETLDAMFFLQAAETEQLGGLLTLDSKEGKRKQSIQSQPLTLNQVRKDLQLAAFHFPGDRRSKK